MRHQVGHRKLGRTTSHRLAMFRNMVTSLVMHERVTTTLHKAKELRFFAERMVTLGKKGDLAARRRAAAFIRSNEAVQKLFSNLAPRFKDRKGGYTRVMKLGYRLGDSAAMAVIEYLPGESVEGTGEPKAKVAKKSAAKVAAKKAPKKEVKEKPDTPKKAAKKTKTNKE